jgi:DNA-binding CsgD family transcriptional regulator
MFLFLVILQFITALFCFSAGVVLFFVFKKTGKKFILHGSEILFSFFLLSLSALSGRIADMIGGVPPVFYFAVNLIFSPLFILGLSGCVFDLVSVPEHARIRFILDFYGVFFVCFYAVVWFSGKFEELKLLLNIVCIWGPCAAALMYTGIRWKKFRNGLFYSGRLLAFWLAVVNFTCLTAGLFFSVLADISPYLFMTSFSLLILVLIFKNYFSPFRTDSKSSSASPSSAFCKSYGITSRERDIICAVLVGKQNKDIAQALCISIKTVESHLGNIYRKTGAANRLELFSLLSR